MRELRAEVTAGQVSASGRMTVSQWAQRWLDVDVRPRLKPSTAAGYESAVRLYIGPVLGSVRLSALTADDVRRLHAVTVARSSTATAAKAHRVLARMLSVALREGLIQRNAAALTTAPSHCPAVQRIPTAREAGRLLDSLRGTPTHARRMCSFVLGAHQGEVLGITLDHLHLDADPPYVELAWEVHRVTWAHGCRPRDGEVWPCGRKRGADCARRFAPAPASLEAEAVVDTGLWLMRPKTVGSHRAVPLPPDLAAAVRDRIRVYRPMRFLFEASPGLPVDPAQDYRAWRAELAAAGLPPMRLHVARSTAATLLLEAGVPDRIIMEILGHTQLATTHHYQRPGLTASATALAGLSAAFAGASGSSSGVSV